jgi:hypothetical protein
MSEGYKIPIDLSALDEMIKKIEAAAEVVKSLDTNVRGLNNSMKSFGGGGGGGGRRATGGNGGIPGMVDTPEKAFNYDVIGGLSGSFRQQNTQRFLNAQQYQQQRQQFLTGKSQYKTPIGPEPFQMEKGFIGPMPILPSYASPSKGYKTPIGPEPFQMEKGFIGPMPILPSYARAAKGYRKPIGPEPFQMEKGFIGPPPPPASRKVSGQTITPAYEDEIKDLLARETKYKGWNRVISRGAISLAQAAMGAGGVPSSIRLASNAGLYAAAAAGAPFAIGAAAVAGMAATVSYGRSVGAERREAMYATGSTAAQAGGLVAMGNGAAGQAAGFGDVLRSGTFSGAYFRNRGLIDYGALTVNKADNFINAIDIIRREKNKDLKSIVIRESGLSNQSAYVDASERMFNDFSKEMKGSIVGEKALKAGQRGISDFEVGIDIQKKRFADLATVLGGIPLGVTASIIGDITSLASGINLENIGRTLSGASGMSAWGLGKRAYDLITNQENTEQKQTRRDNNRKMDPLNERTPRNEISGGGTRVQSSANISQAMSASNAYGLEQAMRIGAFPVY